MTVIEEVKRSLDILKKHNEEQRVIERMNEPLLEQCKTWLEKMRDNKDHADVVEEILANLETYLAKGTGLEDLRKQVEETLVSMVQSKMEELDAYKY